MCYGASNQHLVTGNLRSLMSPMLLLTLVVEVMVAEEVVLQREHLLIVRQCFSFWWRSNSEILLTIANSGPNSMIVEIESIDANDPVDVLIVPGGSGAQISAEDFSVPGKLVEH